MIVPIQPMIGLMRVQSVGVLIARLMASHNAHAFIGLVCSTYRGAHSPIELDVLYLFYLIISSVFKLVILYLQKPDKGYSSRCSRS